MNTLPSHKIKVRTPPPEESSEFAQFVAEFERLCTCQPIPNKDLIASKIPDAKAHNFPLNTMRSALKQAKLL